MRALLLLALAAVLLSLSACTIGGIFGQGGRQVIYQAAKPYVEGCQELEIGPLYKLSNEGDQAGGLADVNLSHELGVIVGGCGQMVELLCVLNPEPGQQQKCSPLALWKQAKPEVQASGLQAQPPADP